MVLDFYKFQVISPEGRNNLEQEKYRHERAREYARIVAQIADTGAAWRRWYASCTMPEGKILHAEV